MSRLAFLKMTSDVTSERLGRYFSLSATGFRLCNAKDDVSPLFVKAYRPYYAPIYVCVSYDGVKYCVDNDFNVRGVVKTTLLDFLNLNPLNVIKEWNVRLDRITKLETIAQKGTCCLIFLEDRFIETEPITSNAHMDSDILLNGYGYILGKAGSNTKRIDDLSQKIKLFSHKKSYDVKFSDGKISSIATFNNLTGDTYDYKQLVKELSLVNIEDFKLTRVEPKKHTLGAYESKVGKRYISGVRLLNEPCSADTPFYKLMVITNNFDTKTYILNNGRAYDKLPYWG